MENKFWKMSWWFMLVATIYFVLKIVIGIIRLTN